MTEYFYRAILSYNTYFDEYEDSVKRGSQYVQIIKMKVLKHTPKGVWLDTAPHYSTLRTWADKRWVSTDPNLKKAYARPTEKEAVQDLKARLNHSLRIHKARVKDVAGGLANVQLYEAFGRGVVEVVKEAAMNFAWNPQSIRLKPSLVLSELNLPFWAVLELEPGKLIVCSITVQEKEIDNKEPFSFGLLFNNGEDVESLYNHVSTVGSDPYAYATSVYIVEGHTYKIMAKHKTMITDLRPVEKESVAGMYPFMVTFKLIH